MKRKNLQFKKGFTLLELLIVIAIIGLLASVVIVQFPEAQKRARIAQGQGFADTLRGSLQADMLGYWPFDETSGTVAEDLWIDQKNGTVTGAVWADGIINGALSFDGLDDYVRINFSNIGFQTIHGPSTLELWFKANSLAGQKRIFSDYCMEWGVYHNGSTIYGRAYNTVSGGVIEADTWYHIAVTHTHPTGLTNTVARIYVNGILKGNSTFSITTHNGYTDSPYYVGSDQCYAGYNFNGLVDEVRIYSVALPQTAVQQHYAQGLKTHQNFAKK